MAESFANMRGTVWLVLIAGLLLCSCAGFDAARELHNSEDPYRGSDYPTAFKTWTRETRIYRGLDLELSAAATLASASFRKAYAAEFTRRYPSGNGSPEVLTANPPEGGAVFVDFILAVYVSAKKGNDFDRPDSIWQLYLTQDDFKPEAGERLAPSEIRRIKKPDARWYHFFPSISPWKTVYRVRFKLPANRQVTVTETTAPANRFSLVISGVQGAATMNWGQDES